MNTILRFIILSRVYKKGFFSLLLKFLGFIPFFYYEVNRIEDKLKDDLASKGHIENGKKISFKVLNFTIINFVLFKGETLTAEHFYFHRSLKDVKFFLKLTKKYFKIDEKSIIFDPACGTGKHLSYITDKYKCKGIGVDIYKNAINVAKKIEKFSNCNFILGDSCNSYTLSSLTKNIHLEEVEIVFINSWIKHVYKNKDFNNFLDFIKKMKCKVMLIEQRKIDLKNIFKTDKILYQKVKNNVQYVILEL